MPSREDESVSDDEQARTPERPPRERFYESTPKSRVKYEEATSYMPGGITRNVLYFDPHPVYADHGDGARIVDVDGNEYLDFQNNYTSLIHGHAPDGPVQGATEAIRRSSAPGMPTEEEIRWASHLVERVPALEKVRFTNSGTEATMNAVRAARAYTGKDVIAKFEGAYHGTHDDALVSVDPPTHLAGPSAEPAAVQKSAGIPDSTLEDVIVLPFNDPDAAIDGLERHRDELAGVIVAPLMGSSVVPAHDAFLHTLDEFTTRHDVPLIVDEVISFRVAHGGAADEFGIEPDLLAFGKLIGGGFPVGAFGGRAELMSGYDPRNGPEIFHSGTFNANPVTAAAGTAALEAYTPGEVERINDRCESLVQGCREVATDRGIDIQLTRHGSLFKIYLTEGAVEDFRDAQRSHTELTRELYFELLTQGMWLSPKLMGCLSTPMDQPEVDDFVEAFDRGLKRLHAKIEREAPHLLIDT